MKQTSGPVFPKGKALAGLIGSGIGHSLTPAMQEEEAGCQGMRLHYQLIDLADKDRAAGLLPQLIAALPLFGFCGVNVTYPVKQAVLPLLDELSDEARAIGAVNTIVNRGGTLIGYNTDSSGWRWGFERALPGADLSCVVLIGAGGAGSAIAHSLLRMQVGELMIYDQIPARAQGLAEELVLQYSGRRVEAAADHARALSTASGLVHATQTGMTGSPGIPIDPSLLDGVAWVAEVVYSPLETDLLKAARKAGCAIVDGGTMAVGQAVGAFELFTGLKADPERMRAHFGRLVAGQSRP